MIEFNKNSWHYRAASFWAQYSVPRSLCPYVRTVLFGAGLWAVIVAFCCAFAVGNLFALVAVLSGLPLMELPEYVKGAVILAGGLSLGFLMIFSVIQWKGYKERKRQREYELKFGQNSNYVEPQPGLFTLYWRAIHDKLCPTITFKDDSA